LTFFGKAIYIFSNPGYIRKIPYDSRNVENALIKISDEFERQDIEKLTPLENICFTCLRMKGPHVEHCKKCN
jgi:hypothetical protein